MLIKRKAEKEDLPDLLELYTYLHGNSLPLIDSRITDIWNDIINDPYHSILMGFVGNNLVSSCVLVVIKNLTRDQRPYALVENVVTRPEFRNLGYAHALLDMARDTAITHNCYKIMLMTSSKETGTMEFYRCAGYNSEDKTAFIQWFS